MATVEEIAKDTVELNRAMRFQEAGDRHWAPDIVSVEPMEGPMQVSRGLEQVHAKGRWWAENFDVHGLEVEGPYVNGEQFVVRYTMDTTNKMNGERMTADEVGVYTVRDGKIAEERFFYAGPPQG